MCNCGSSGFLELTDVENILQDIRIAKGGLKYIQNRLCCNIDKLPMFSVVKKQLKKYEYKVICKNCGAVFEDKIDLTPASTWNCLFAEMSGWQTPLTGKAMGISVHHLLWY